MDYGVRATFTEPFAIVEQCDCVLYQYDATELVFLLVDSSKSQNTSIAALWLAKAEVDKTLYCWCCGESDHVMKDCHAK